MYLAKAVKVDDYRRYVTAARNGTNSMAILYAARLCGAAAFLLGKLVGRSRDG